MSAKKFNAAVNTIGIADVKVRQALMKLLENSVFNREQMNRDKDSLEEQIRRLSQKLSTIDETYSFAVLNTDCGTGNTAFPMAGIVLNTDAIYTVRVLFRNTSTTECTCVANGTNVSLAAGVGSTASHKFYLAGNGEITIDNISSSVDVFITIWR